MDNNLTSSDEALIYHSQGRPGKIEVVPTKPCLTQIDLSLAYSPGVAEPCLEIAEDRSKVFEYTATTGDYLITWQDSRNYSGTVAPNDDIYLQQLSDDTFVLGSNGISVCDAVFSQIYPQIELYNEDDNSYMIFWNDLRSSDSKNI